ncbi:hypothetical protein M409DRAFT_36598 [Zasmidium cellare ATCC 36951]|uniref:Uncharacterized protein n=1 Tax=Zasmidium cellare ATCC 36951 TaxID=1080233 RepID=A0A6A6CJM1_ZASCE|nr:uncharacterized protein M409DRAFT_36598 [Zasmidium cellare ATCC 36951]KAF2167434.1 hypothetical protein M409DRAFT_36598 [Zasmidium cellare ATCC 36951]
MNLKNRKILITGGSRGIGKAIAQAFAGEGCHVAINYLTSEKLATDLSTELRDQHGVTTVTIQADVSRENDCQALVQKSIQALGGLDIVVSNAGNTKIAPFHDIFALSSSDWDYTFNTLVKSNIFLLQEAHALFNSNPDGGCFLVMSSLAALVTDGSSLAYSVSRAATNHLVRCLAKSQGPKIRVNGVCPGLTDTERILREGYVEKSGLKRITTTEDVAETFVFLAKNRGVTGECIRVDSGMAI